MYKYFIAGSIFSIIMIACSGNIKNSVSDIPSLLPTDNRTEDNDNNIEDGDADYSNIGGAESDIDNYTYIPPSVCTFQKNTNPIKSIIATTGNGIYRSVDYGLSWQRSLLPITAESIWISVVDIGDNTVLAGSGVGTDNKSFGIIKSTDGGVSWRKTGMTVGAWNDLIFLGGSVIVAGSSSEKVGGVWRSTDLGETWIRNKRTNSSDAISEFTADGISTGIVDSFGRVDNCTIILSKNIPISGRYNNPIHISKTGGKSWYSAVNQPSGKSISSFLLHSSGTLYVTFSDYNGISKSDNAEYFWDTNIYKNYSFKPIAELTNKIVVLGVTDINRASISGDINGQLHGGIKLIKPENNYEIQNSNMGSFFWLSMIALDNGTALAGCTNSADIDNYRCSGLFLSDIYGENWIKLTNSISNLTVYKLSVIR